MARNPIAALVDPAMYKHVSSDDDKTVLRHKAGHTLTIAHKVLSPTMQSQLKALAGAGKEDQTQDQKQEAASPYGKVTVKAKGGEVNPKLEQSKKIPLKGYCSGTMRAGYAQGGNTKKGDPEPQTLSMQQEGTPPPIDKTQSDKEADAKRGFENGPKTPSMQEMWDRLKNGYVEGGKVGIPDTKDSTASQSGSHPAIDVPSTPSDSPLKTGDWSHIWRAKGGGVQKYAEGDPDIGGVSKITGLPQGESLPDTDEQRIKRGVDERISQLKDLHSIFNAGANTKARESIEAQNPYNAPQASPQDDDTQPSTNPPSPLEPNSEANSASQPSSPEQSDDATGKEYDASEEIANEANGIMPQSKAQPAPQQASVAAARPPQTYEEHKKSLLDGLNTEDEAYQQDLLDGHITPKTYASLFADKSTLGKVGTLFGMLVSGMGSGLAHQSNAVIDAMNKTIENDYNAQVQSKTNAQNLYKLSMANELNKANVGLVGANAYNTRQEAQMKAWTLGRIHANNNALHKLVADTQALPEGSPKRVEQEQALGMLAQSVQTENFDLKDRAATNMALYRMKTQVGNGDPASQVRQKELLGYISPEQSRAALQEIGHTANHVQLNANALESFDRVAKMSTIASKLANPVQNQKRIDAEWFPMMDKLTKDTEGRVTPITVDLMSKLKPELTDNAATTKDKRQKLNAILNSGMATPTLDSLGIAVNKGEQPSTTVKMIGPSGKSYDVPKANLQKAIAMGLKEAGQ